MKPLFDTFLFGGDWNPEQWPEETWEHDIEMLEDAHINEVTINVFSWALLQPNEDDYDFTMLDRIVKLLVSHHFNIVMATSTAALPAWLVRTHPKVIRADADGRRRAFGGRHNACPCSSVYQRLSKKLALRLARRYQGTPGLVAWHVCNEYGGMCYCENCAKDFRRWLKAQYGTIDALNQAWCANYWGHTLTQWDDVVPPTTNGDGIGTEKSVIPGLLMDYRRFQNDLLLACYTRERDAIRRYDKTTPITTNLMGTFKDLDYFKWGRQLDVISWDNYPGMDMPSSFTAMCHDLMRGVGGGKPFMLMEQTPNQQNWFPYCKVKRPGEVRMLSWQAVAHGADTVQFFQMKQSIGGVERSHGAIIAHDGTENTRVFRETERLGAELERCAEPMMGSATKARVAIMFDWESYWSLEGWVGPTTGFSYPNEVHRFYRALYKHNIPVDFIESTADAETLARYPLIVAPALIMVKPHVACRLEDYVRAGGQFVTGYMAGMDDEHDLVVPGGYPGELRKLMGVRVEEIDALAPDAKIPIDCAALPAAYASSGLSPLSGKGEIVASIMHPEGENVTVLANYGGNEFYAGSPAVTVHEFGSGSAYYVGTPLDERGMDSLFDLVVESVSGLDSVIAPEGIEIDRRTADDGRTFIFVINTSGQPVSGVDLRFLAGSREILGNAEVPTEADLKPYEVLICQ